MKKRLLQNAILTSLFLSLLSCFTGLAYAQSAAPSSGYSLIGTIQGDDFAGAVIRAGNEQTFYRLGEKLPDGSQIIKVRPDTILLKGSDGMTYEMYILHETKSVGTAQPQLPASDPYAGKTWTPPTERPLTAYEKRRVQRLKNRNLNPDDE